MATRSYIGRQNQDGSIDYVYCHWDGYPSYNGTVLQEHYTDPVKVDELLALGSLSFLGKEIGEKQNFDDRSTQNEDWCLAYGRDRGELEQEFRTAMDAEDLFKQAKMYVDYVYVFADGEWRCFNSWSKCEEKIPKKELVD